MIVNNIKFNPNNDARVAIPVLQGEGYADVSGALESRANASRPPRRDIGLIEQIVHFQVSRPAIAESPPRHQVNKDMCIDRIIRSKRTLSRGRAHFADVAGSKIYAECIALKPCCSA